MTPNRIATPEAVLIHHLRRDDRPSWPTGFHPHCATPITLPARQQPLVACGDAVTQIPCRHGPEKSPLLMPDIRLQVFYPLVPNRSGSCCCGGVHIRPVRLLCAEYSGMPVHMRSPKPCAVSRVLELRQLLHWNFVPAEQRQKISKRRLGETGANDKRIPLVA